VKAADPLRGTLRSSRLRLRKNAAFPRREAAPERGLCVRRRVRGKTSCERSGFVFCCWRRCRWQPRDLREHLAAIQEILASLSANDFDGVAKSASRIGYSEQMGRMCSHMGSGTPGFTETALNFHRTADTIGTAAKQRDAAAALKAVSATLQTCVGCHATFRQEIVDEAAWEKLTKQP
jgi:mono/diheme cytochrome c family protein